MQPAKTWSDADIYTFRTLWKRGASIAEIAAVLKRTPAAVQLKRRHLELTRREDRQGGPGRPVTVWTEERLAILRRDWAARVPTDLIVEAINRLPGARVTAKVVMWNANHRGLKRGPRPPAPPPTGKGRRTGRKSLIWTPQRDAVLREAYPSSVPLGEILARLNRLPGRAAEEAHCWQRAKSLGLSRRQTTASAFDLATIAPSPLGDTSGSITSPELDDPPYLASAGDEPEPAPLPIVDHPPPPQEPGPRITLTRDGAPSVASLMAAAAPVPGAPEPIAWADALRWAQHNKVRLDGPPAEILRRINAARAPMPPWRIVRARRPDDPLPPPWFGTNNESDSKPTKGTP